MILGKKEEKVCMLAEGSAIVCSIPSIPLGSSNTVHSVSSSSWERVMGDVLRPRARLEGTWRAYLQAVCNQRFQSLVFRTWVLLTVKNCKTAEYF